MHVRSILALLLTENAHKQLDQLVFVLGVLVSQSVFNFWDVQ